MSNYELNADVPFGRPLHERIVSRLRAYLKSSQQKISERYTKWRQSEDLFLAYVKETEEDARRREKREQEGIQTYSQIAVPYSYAMLLTAHTYWSSVFMGRNPVNQFTGRHGETQQQIQALEALVDYQVQVGEMLVPYYNWLLDVGKYGVGVVSCYWTEEKSMIAKYEMVPETWAGVEVPGTSKKQRIEMEATAYAGNKLMNVRPYDWRPDPRVSLANFQKGEFCGHLAYPTWNDLLRGDQYINRDALKLLKDRRGSSERETGSGNISLPDWDGSTSSHSSYFEGRNQPTTVECFEVVVELVPSEWGLGESERLEKWVFTLAIQDVVIRARPLGCWHNKFPYQVLQYEVDAYSYQSRGMMEVMKPLNEVMNWLVNSHFFNVRKALNDTLIVDPSRVTLKDLKDGGPGKIIRLTPAAYGTDPKTAVTQLGMQDITRSHLADMQLAGEMMQRTSGVTDNIMGLLDPGGRKTATEVRTSSNFGINRLKTAAEYFSALGFAPLAQMLVQNTQQYYDLEQKFKIAGDLLMGNEKFLMVKPEMIQGFYDFVPVDGTLPVDRFAQANLWKEILMGAAQMPFLAQSYDLGGIFQWMAQLAGLKNITQFKLAPQMGMPGMPPSVSVLPDDQVRDMAATGKVVPIGQRPQVTGNQTTSAAGVGAIPQV